MPAWIMSPQARRRLLAAMTESELRDLAAEIARDLFAAPSDSRINITLASDSIFATLRREA